jgi:5'(3')-deoxyribonucleotidase
MKRNKPIFLCDVDGVLADFTTSLLKESGSKLTVSDIDDWDCFSIMEPESRDLALNKILRDKEFWGNLPLLPHAQIAVEDMRRRGTVLFVTSPWANRTRGWECDGWGHARAHWLRRHFDASHEELIIAYSKQYVQGDFLIDDRFKNIKAYADHNKYALAFFMRQNHNIKDEWENEVHIREHGWEFSSRGEVLTLDELVNEWKLVNA